MVQYTSFSCLGRHRNETDCKHRHQYVKLAHAQIGMLFRSAVQQQDSATAEALCKEPSLRRYKELCSSNVRCMEGNPDITNARYDKHVYFVTAYHYHLTLLRFKDCWPWAGDWVRNYIFISDGVIQGDNMKRFCLRKAAEFECL